MEKVGLHLVCIWGKVVCIWSVIQNFSSTDLLCHHWIRLVTRFLSGIVYSWISLRRTYHKTGFLYKAFKNFSSNIYFSGQTLLRSNLYNADISIKRTLFNGPNGVHFRGIPLYFVSSDLIYKYQSNIKSLLEVCLLRVGCGFQERGFH